MNGNMNEITLKEIVKTRSMKLFENTLSLLENEKNDTIESQREFLEKDAIGKILLKIKGNINN